MCITIIIAIPISIFLSCDNHFLCISLAQRIPALLNAPLIQNITNDHLKGFPVVVYSHGLACHFLHSSGFCSDLASYGYVVAAVEHRDSSATLALRRVPGPGVQEGQYEQYVDEWIPFNMIISITHPERRTFNYPFRNKQVNSLYTAHFFAK